MPSSALKTILFAAFICIFGLVLYSQRNPGQSLQPFSAKIEDFTAINIDGGKTTYQKEKGAATLIVLSASWCPACVSEIPALKRLHTEFRERNVKILMISEDDNVKTASRFKKKNELPWTVVHWNYDLMNLLGNPGVIPVSYLVNGKDSIVQIHTGIFDESELRKMLRELVDTNGD
ncbi:MAG: TlpA family protein disulfide reductase [Fibrobacter sp.]|nr:TlpA family protein disulfide reductase [Fibrobacter sp.]